MSLRWLIILAFVFFGCTSINRYSEKNLYIKLERDECFGMCEAYTVEITGDGKVVYSGKANVKTIGVKEYFITQEQVEELAAQFEKKNFFSMKTGPDTGYSEGMPMGIYAKIADKSNKVESNTNVMPKEYFELARLIDSITGVNTLIR